MRNEQEVWYNTFAIVSKPGDATIYEYMVYRDGPDEFCFMPMRSTFRFPQRLDYFEVVEMPTSREQMMKSKELFEMANELNCNPNTLMECIRTIKILHKKALK